MSRKNTIFKKLLLTGIFVLIFSTLFSNVAAEEIEVDIELENGANLIPSVEKDLDDINCDFSYFVDSNEEEISSSDKPFLYFDPAGGGWVETDTLDHENKALWAPLNAEECEFSAKRSYSEEIDLDTGMNLLAISEEVDTEIFSHSGCNIGPFSVTETGSPFASYNHETEVFESSNVVPENEPFYVAIGSECELDLDEEDEGVEGPEEPTEEKEVDCQEEYGDEYWCDTHDGWEEECGSDGEAIELGIEEYCTIDGEEKDYCVTCKVEDDEDNDDEEDDEKPETLDGCQQGEFQVEMSYLFGELELPVEGDMEFRGMENDYCPISYSLDFQEESIDDIVESMKEIYGEEITEDDLEFMFPTLTGEESYCFVPEEDFEEFHQNLLDEEVSEVFGRCSGHSFFRESDFLDFKEIMGDFSDGVYTGELEWEAYLFFSGIFFTDETDFRGSCDDDEYCVFVSQTVSIELPETYDDEEAEDVKEELYDDPGYCIELCDDLVESLLEWRDTGSISSKTGETPEELNFSDTIEDEDGNFETYSYVTQIIDGVKCVYASDKLIEMDPYIDDGDGILEILLDFKKEEDEGNGESDEINKATCTEHISSEGFSVNVCSEYDHNLNVIGGELKEGGYLVIEPNLEEGHDFVKYIGDTDKLVEDETEPENEIILEGDVYIGFDTDY